ncbi:helix-turn-helix domain-containing protein [Chloroflexota bacterium]
MGNLSEKVKQLRAKRGWTQEDLARRLGVSLSTIQRWESRGGKPTQLARKALEKLFKKTGIASKVLESWSDEGSADY